jgi:hypothetical protein
MLALIVSLALVAEHVPGVEPSPAPATPASAESPPADSTAYSFIGVTPDGDPYRWNPCAPIRYRVDLGPMPESALDDVREAVRLTSEASGLEFEFDGLVRGTSPTNVIERMDFVSYRADGSAEWNPVLIAFAHRDVLRRFGAGRALGIAFPVHSRNDVDQLVTGLVVINVDAGLAPGFADIESIGPVVEHELGHIVGLAHVEQPFQLMFPAPIVRRWNDGDLSGLRRLGEGSCLHVPTAYAPSASVVPTKHG